MKSVKTAILVVIVAAGATPAWAQFGLYGSPEVLNLSPVNPATLSYARQTAQSADPLAPDAPSATVRYVSVTNGQSGTSIRRVSDGQYAELPVESAARKPWYYAPDTPEADAPAPGGNNGDQVFGDTCCAEEACCGDPGCGGAKRGSWYASVSALVMGRNRANRLWTSYNGLDEADQLPSDIGLPWSWGGEVRFGHRWCCCGWSLEAVYWGLDPFNGYTSVTHANGVSTPLTISGIEFAGVNGTTYFDMAAEHRLWREDEVHNVEVNLVRNPVSAGYGGPWEIDWLFGVRYFHFRDSWTFGSLQGSYAWGQDGGIREAYLYDNITNDLVGFQFGFDANYYARPTLQFYAAPRLGIYNNHINNYFNAYRGDGTVANPTVASGQPGSFPVGSSHDVVAFLMQIDLGLRWRFSERWSAHAGYRLVAVTDVGLADEQIPPYVVDIPEIGSIDHNGDLVLHGAFFGLGYNF